MKMQPTICRLCQDLNIEQKGEYKIIKTCIVIDDQFIYITVFGATAEYLYKYGKKGGRVLLKDWELSVKKINDKTVYDFNVRKLDIIDFKESE